MRTVFHKQIIGPSGNIVALEYDVDLPSFLNKDISIYFNGSDKSEIFEEVIESLNIVWKPVLTQEVLLVPTTKDSKEDMEAEISYYKKSFWRDAVID